MRPHVIGITGSMGKTSTKEALVAVLSTTQKVLYAKGGYNSEIGLPLFILGLTSPMSSSVIAWLKVLFMSLPRIFTDNNYDTLILEMGVDAPGDMDILLSLCVPNIAILTGIEAVHIGPKQFSSKEDILREKWKLAAATVKKSGTVIINNDDPLLSSAATSLSSYLSYGKQQSSTLRIVNTTTEGAVLQATYQYNMVHDTYTINARGAFHAYIVAPALLVGHLSTLDFHTLSKGISAYKPPKGRGRVLHGVNESILVDSSYNAMPTTVIAGVQSISTYTEGRRIAIIGQMNEQGNQSIGRHKQVGAALAELSLDALIGIHGHASDMIDSFKQLQPSSEALFFASAKDAIPFLLTFIQPKDIVYIKGSQTNVRLERVVKALLADPEKDSKQLIRQGQAWEKNE